MNFYDWATGWIRYLRGEVRLDEDRLDTLERKVTTMADVLDTLKADFESYQGLVTSTLSALQAKVAELSAGALDPAKAQAIDDEIKAATDKLTPPAA